MELLIFAAQPEENLLCILFPWLFHQNSLETARKGAVLRKVFLILAARCCTDNLHFSACKCRLQNIGSIKRALRTTGADERMDLIDEENNVLRLDDLIHDILEPLLELTTILRPCNQ